ncbi:hypothetical protein L9G16_07065 [Shewanella sp. A25]|nr:hypothetical protein [Shewanella shenzhenensis]
MKRSEKISAIMYKLLVEKGMDSFSVVDARNLLVALDAKYNDLAATRQVVYRQINKCLKQGWLVSAGVGRQKKFYVSDSLKEMIAVNNNALKASENKSKPNDYSVLLTELRENEGELKIVLGEIDEYRSLVKRFPELLLTIQPLLQDSKVRSATLLGKVNGLTKVLQTLHLEDSGC